MKQRLTITLSQNILRQLDKIIDGTQIRNRSHAIESVLESSLQPKISTALILAGGPSEKQSVAKATMQFGDKPLLLYTLGHLRAFGCDTVIIATNTEGAVLRELVATHSMPGLNVRVEIEQTPLGTAGAVQTYMRKYTPQHACLVLSGDVLTNIDLHDMSAFHTQNQALVTMAVKPREARASYDNVYMQGHTVVDFQPSKPTQTVSLVNAGVYIIEPAALDFFPGQVPAMLETDVFPKLAKQHKLLAFPFQGAWFDVATEPNMKAHYQSIVETQNK